MSPSPSGGAAVECGLETAERGAIDDGLPLVHPDGPVSVTHQGTVKDGGAVDGRVPQECPDAGRVPHRAPLGHQTPTVPLDADRAGVRGAVDDTGDSAPQRLRAFRVRTPDEAG